MNRLLQKLPVLFAVTLLLGITVSAFGQTPSAPRPNVEAQSEQGQQNPAAKFVQDLGNKAIGVMADKNLTESQRTAKYSELLRDSFDIPRIGRFVLGRAWNTATPQQQQEYLKLFESLVVKTYGNRLNLYSGESFRVTGARQENDKDVRVSSMIDRPGGAPPTPVDWRVTQANGRYAIVDVIVDGISQSVTQRQEYASILERNGGSIDALLGLMRERLQKTETPAGE